MAFSVTVTDANGCEGTGTVNVTAVDCSGIDDQDAGNNMTFWPNPNDGNFFVKIKGISGDASLKITGASGQLISHENMTIHGEVIKELNLGHLAPGIYFIHLSAENGLLTKKVMIR